MDEQKKSLFTPTNNPIDFEHNKIHREQHFKRALDLYKFHGQLPKNDLSGLDPELIKDFQIIPFFKKMKPANEKISDFVTQILKKFKYEVFKPEKAVFNYGDYGDKYYLILKGSCRIYIPKTDEEIEQERQTREFYPMGDMNLHDYLLFLKNQHNLQISPDDIVLSKQQKSPQYFDDKKICKFKSMWTMLAGDNFGEIALITSKARSASVVTVEDTELLSLGKKDYRNIFKASGQKMKQKIDLYAITLHTASRVSINKFSYSFKEQTYGCGDIIYKQGELADFFFLIFEGNVGVYKEVPQELNAVFSPKNIYYKKSTINKHLQICIHGSGNFIGEEDIVNGQKPHSYTVKALDEVIMNKITYENFQKVKNQYNEIVSCLRLRIAQKQQWLEVREKEVQDDKRQVGDTKKSEFEREMIEIDGRITVQDINIMISQFPAIPPSRNPTQESYEAKKLKSPVKSNNKIISQNQKIIKKEIIIDTLIGQSTKRGINSNENMQVLDSLLKKKNYLSPKIAKMSFSNPSLAVPVVAISEFEQKCIPQDLVKKDFFLGKSLAIKIRKFNQSNHSAIDTVLKQSFQQESNENKKINFSQYFKTPNQGLQKGITSQRSKASLMLYPMEEMLDIKFSQTPYMSIINDNLPINLNLHPRPRTSHPYTKHSHSFSNSIRGFIKTYNIRSQSFVQSTNAANRSLFVNNANRSSFANLQYKNANTSNTAVSRRCKSAHNIKNQQKHISI